MDTRPADLVWYESGQAGYGGALLALSRKLESLFLSWAAQVRATEYVFPPFLRAADLARIDYLSSFPHLATFPVTLDAEESNLERFVAAQKGASPETVTLTATSPISDVLTPAACYHVYVHLKGQTLPRARYVTTRATCYRREVAYVPLERQWAFSMREIVCVGAAEDVKGFLASMQAKLETFFRDVGLPIRFMHATDPFFQPLKNPKTLAQRLDPVKTEMVFDDRLAIGSFNFHRNYFGEGYQITYDGQDAFSGCVAFGIERWMSAILKTYGTDPAGWPAAFSVEGA